MSSRMAKCSFKGIPCTIPQGLEDRNTLARAFKCICIAYSIALERIHVDSLKSKHANPTYISEAWSQRGSKWCRKSINVNQNYFAESSSSTRYSASQSQTRHHFRSYFASYFHLNIFSRIPTQNCCTLSKLWIFVHQRNGTLKDYSECKEIKGTYLISNSLELKI